MKITILTLGTRGDVQPYIALGTELQQAGHSVTMGTGTNFQPLVASYGLGYAPLHADFFQLMQTAEGRAAIKSARGALHMWRKLLPALRQVLDDGWAAAQEAEAIIYHPKALSGYHVAEKLGSPAFLSLPTPACSPTRSFPIPLAPLPNLGGPLNKLSYKLFLRLATVPYRRLINRWRRERLGLGPHALLADELYLDGQPIERLYCCSRHVVPPPSDWDQHSHMTGYWFPPRQHEWKPPRELVNFLSSGTAPVYVGFGSIAGDNPEQLARLVIEALRIAGQRGVLAAGWGGLASSAAPESVYLLESVPHDWLFPQVAAVVHHGGAGTTGEGLRAGKPTVICPYFGDQPFWGQRIFKLGAGPRPIPQKKVTAERLAAAIHVAVTDTDIRRRAAELGARLRAEQGITSAAKIIMQRATS